MEFNTSLKSVNINKVIFILIVISITSCGNIDRPEIPLTEKEITFFDQLEHDWPTIDSINRDVAIGYFLKKKFNETVTTNIYFSNDDLTKKERVSLSNQIASFYSKLEINETKFKYCLIYYFDSKDNERESSFHFYRFENEVYISDGKSY